jgi:RNA polymerase sigma-70 factor (ECF subfamily)
LTIGFDRKVLGRKVENLASKRARIANLYETHFERVARYIAVRIGNVSEAEDLASEVFVRALRSADTYQETGAPIEAWVFKIAHNAVVDHLRKRGRRPPLVQIDETLPLASTHDPTENLERQQEVGQLYRAVSRLSKGQQQVLALRFGAEMAAEQAAQAMGKRPGAVREMQSAALKKLREILRSDPARIAP